MPSTVETTEKNTVKLTVEVPTDEVSKDLDRAYRTIANAVRIPGFRKGKVPKPIIDAQVGRDAVIEQFLEDSVPTYYRDAVREHDLAPIADPELDVDPLEDGSPLTFTATVEVRPRLDLTASEYEHLAVKRPSTDVSDAEVDEWIDRLRERFAELEPVSRPVQSEDFVTIDLSAQRSGEPVDAAARPDYLYFVSSGEFGPVLDAELAGTKPGDILKFTAELPERFGEPHGGQAVEFQVLVKDVKTRRLPEADDAFAQTASELDTLDQLRDDLRERVHEQKEREADAALRDRVLSALVDAVEVELPQSLVEDETRHRVTHARERAEQMGLTLEQLLEIQGWDLARLEEDSRAHARRAIVGDIALEGVARVENLEVSADEIGAEIATLAQAYGREPKDVATSLDRSGQMVTLAGDIIRTKALDLLVERADITQETPEETAASAAEAEAEEAEAVEAAAGAESTESKETP